MTWVFVIPEAVCFVPNQPNLDVAFLLEGKQLLEAVAGREVALEQCKVAHAVSGVAHPINTSDAIEVSER